ncbi:MAG: site-specific integrase [Phycisphaerae bacterium]|nr:site-specific integrase [Phycisphaerae bacterium]
MTGGLKPVEKNWHYVSLEEFYKLLAACPNQGWRTFLGLCRLAGLRQGEALSLPWRDVDWETNRLSVWGNKTKRRRIVPIAPELLPILRDAFEHAPEGEALVVFGVVAQNVWRDFGVIRKRAGVPKFPRWCHTLRKNRERDWMDAGFAFHVVVEWMGHSDEVARQHYLRVDERDLSAATHSLIGTKVTQLGVSEPQEPKQPDSQPSADQGVEETAGDRIRTDDVQLGKSLLIACRKAQETQSSQ